MKVDMKTFEIVRLHMGEDGLEFIDTVCGPFKTLAKAQQTKANKQLLHQHLKILISSFKHQLPNFDKI